MMKGILLIVEAAVKGNVFGPVVSRACRINLFWSQLGRIKASLATVKDSPCDWKAILRLEGTWWNFLVVWDVALLKIEAFPGAVPVDLLCGCCCLLSDLMVGVSVAEVVAFM